MSRNIGSTQCNFCGGEVVLIETPRPITRKEAGVYYDTCEGYGYANGIFANGACLTCEAKYLAWVNLSACAGYGQWNRNRLQEPFFDLSYRATFNDEPDEEDLPEWAIQTVPLTEEQCRKLEVFSGTLKKRKPWPRCEKTGRKVYIVYGCPCLEHRP